MKVLQSIKKIITPPQQIQIGGRDQKHHNTMMIQIVGMNQVAAKRVIGIMNLEIGIVIIKSKEVDMTLVVRSQVTVTVINQGVILKLKTKNQTLVAHSIIAQSIKMVKNQRMGKRDPQGGAEIGQGARE